MKSSQSTRLWLDTINAGMPAWAVHTQAAKLAEKEAKAAKLAAKKEALAAAAAAQAAKKAAGTNAADDKKAAAEAKKVSSVQEMQCRMRETTQNSNEQRWGKGGTQAVQGQLIHGPRQQMEALLAFFCALSCHRGVVLPC